MDAADDLFPKIHEQFQQQGFLVVPGLAEDHLYQTLRALAEEHLNRDLGPIEYEADVQYPGSPVDGQSQGGLTPRRLLNACSRGQAFLNWATGTKIRQVLEILFTAKDLMLSQCHHNCIMTKCPGFSSATLWHQDNRYWKFQEENLISAWLALGRESRSNGCLRVIPGSHNMHFDADRLDGKLFLRPELEENKRLIRTASIVELLPGDVLFFHSRLMHAAGRNLTDQVKYSLVFTYHRENNQPVNNTRSSRYRSISLGDAKQN